MEKLKSFEIREKFLNFFKKNNHHIIKSSSIVPLHDPSLLFINSGMAPLKKYFLGEDVPPSKRLANVQPCIRTKDIDDVGDRHHLTLFEMLGSWSIGDYYKKLAIELAYELLVKELRFDPNLLYVTIYKGDPALNLPPDHESAKAWQDVGIPSERIIALGKDNFWGPAGDYGPCGPCTEVFFDFGPEYGPAYKPGDEFDTTKRYIEIWNAGVFMEFNKMLDGSFAPLPLKSVDTGSGLERMCMAMNQLQTVYETDLFVPIMKASSNLFTKKVDISSIRMISDHMRASTFMLAEGVFPSNEGRGYIPRRLLRKCISVCVAQGVDSYLLQEVAQATCDNLGDFYQILKTNKQQIQKAIKEEIKDFTPIIGQGLKILKEMLESTKGKTLSGDNVFNLVTTHGVPLEVVKKFCSDDGYEVDDSTFEKRFSEHQNISRAGSKSAASSKGSALFSTIEANLKDEPETVFTGYDKLSETTNIQKIFSETGESLNSFDQLDSHFYFTTPTTCFYGEGGGQVGDKGYASSTNAKINIVNTIKINVIFLHQGQLVSGKVKTNDPITLSVEESTRVLTRRNHSATHLLHAALRKILGEHVVQKGSYVDANKLRFDFQHPQALSEDELNQIEAQVNEWIWANTNTLSEVKSYSEAIADGALALFSEKYQNDVRVVSFGGHSTELCGGTHVISTGEIGSFIITSEASVARGVRRIEAITSDAAYKYLKQQIQTLKSACRSLAATPDNLVEKISQLKTNSSKKPAATTAPASDVKLENIVHNKSGVNVALGILNSDPASVKLFCEQLIQKKVTEAVCIISHVDGSVRFFVLITDETSKKLAANALLKPMLETIQARGGGKPTMAQGGGPTDLDIESIYNKAKIIITEA